VPAGTWHLVADSIIIEAVDAHFELLWRRAGRDDVLIAEWTHHFEPIGAGEYTPQPYEDEAAGEALDVEDGDQLVFRYSATGSDLPMAYVPNGDGPPGRIPYIDLPQ